MNKTISITPEVAMLVDWLITMHSYEPGLMEMLLDANFQGLRRQVGKIILTEEEGKVTFNEDMLSKLLVLAPITFRFAEQDIGLELKKKLFEALIGKVYKLNLEIAEKVENGKENDGDTSQGSTESAPEDSAGA